MAGRNNKPDNDGPSSSPDRLDQYGDKLTSRNDEEFQAEAIDAACGSDDEANR
ncbi:hypothetical protein ACFQWB_04910 [Paenibacillus thermoaerophilus]|uniref:YfhD-like protein n=1 Tax=Paenibacillus thermoaerophilus TaxID=1215385 RepID=A0ABW2V218_9BACL|nr:hypothetical protein [Paenibacillus thermoaerophilus]